MNRLNHRLENVFPERRLFLRSDNETRYILLKPVTQLVGIVGSTAVVAWSIIATSILIMDNIGAGNFREQAKRDQAFYLERLNALADERDTRAAEALASQERFNTALSQISVMQTQLLETQERRRELEIGMEAFQKTLRRVSGGREDAREKLQELNASLEGKTETGQNPLSAARDLETTVNYLAGALSETAGERDTVVADAQAALVAADEMAAELKILEDRNNEIFRTLEEAMTVSVEPLDKMFRKAGLSTDNLLKQVRRGYSGQGGPLAPLSFSTRGEIDPSTERANSIIGKLDELNLYRIAAQKAPFTMPLKNNYRFTSGFGPRWGRIHKGTDFAAPVGTPIYAPADGVVTFAGWSSGYGRLVKIKHEFGIETRYAHQSRIRVKVGQRVSRGDRIGDIGNSGRSTGPHLHYEIRVGGRPINPMIYIKAGQNVF
jgi:murein DD-endopeptidase MepM/ murein hydrolase activator NlpD